MSEKPAAGPGAVLSTVRSVRGMGVSRGVQTLRLLNQTRGFDCPGCAWPDPDDRARVEFCENGAKAVAHEATPLRVTRDFFAQWSIEKLLAQPDRWLEAQGRLSEPMIKRAGATHYEPVSWQEAIARIADVLRGLATPDEALFYTSGRTSNEAAFLYQLFARAFGTNNLPDCSNMCHESSGTGLSEVIGVGKGTVSLADFERAELILVLGQNPGSNHPRMLSALQAAKRLGCKIVSINPLRERGLVSFANPQEPLGLLGRGTPIADHFLQVRVGGDVALLKGIMKQLLRLDAEASEPLLDGDFIASHTHGFAEFEAGLAAQDFSELERESGVSRAQMAETAELYAGSQRVIACWAMGLTQHRHGVGNVQELVNLLLLRGNLGRHGAGVCPVRGHSNVQGDRTMGIWEKPEPEFLDRLAAEFGFEPPRAHGHDTVAAIEAMHAGNAKVFIAMGGNFVRATPDTERVAEALAHTELSVQISTKLNRSHLVTGQEAILLPCLGRTERDQQASGAQLVSVEDSMSVVHASQGHLEPGSEELRSEPAIVCALAEAVLGVDRPVVWGELAADYDRIRDHIERVVPGFEDFNRRVREPGGFVLPSGARTRDFATASGKAHFSVQELPRIELAPGQLLLMTLRSHDQYNTTIYSEDDRYRGVYGERRVVFLHEADMRERDLHEGQRVDLTSHWPDGEKRNVRGFFVRAYDLPPGCAAAYFPEANGLVPTSAFDARSRTPAYKSIPVTLAPARP